MLLPRGRRAALAGNLFSLRPSRRCQPAAAGPQLLPVVGGFSCERIVGANWRAIMGRGGSAAKTSFRACACRKRCCHQGRGTTPGAASRVHLSRAGAPAAFTYPGGWPQTGDGAQSCGLRHGRLRGVKPPRRTRLLCAVRRCPGLDEEERGCETGCTLPRLARLFASGAACQRLTCRRHAV